MAYIKFQRGSLAAYKALSVKDPDTLYFIYADGESATGSLYLGESLISGGDVIVQTAKLDDLADVIVTAAGTGDFLVKGSDGNWMPKSASAVAAEVLNTLKLNSTLSLDSNGALGITGFAEAKAGAQLVKGSDGNMSWVVPSAETVEGLQTTVSQLSESVEALDGEVETLKTDLANKVSKEELATDIAKLDHLKRIVVDSLPVSNIDENAIYMIAKTGSEGDTYNEYMYINGKWEKIGDTSVNLDGYATKNDLLLKVDKVDGSRLMTNAEGDKLAGIAAGAEVNVINSVSSDFTIDENRNLILNNISVKKIVDLETLLNNKVSSEDFETLSGRVDDLEVRTTWVEM